MNTNDGIARILDSTTQAGPKMVEALAAYGDGRMGAGILKLADWSRQDGRALGLLQGRIEGVAVTAAISSVFFAAITFFMHRQLKKEEQRNQDMIADLIDEIGVYEAQRKAASVIVEKAEEDASNQDTANTPSVVLCPGSLIQ